MPRASGAPKLCCRFWYGCGGKYTNRRDTTMARRASTKRKHRRKAKKAQTKVLDDACHEAAHAVAAIRLGLPLDYTSIGSLGESAMKKELDIFGRGDLPADFTLRSVGYTTYIEGTMQGWVDALPAESARQSLEAASAETAAGIVAETRMGGKPGDLACRSDVRSLVAVAAALGIGRSTEEPKVREFIADAYERAAEVLFEDDGRGWDAVTLALAEHRYLSGDAVAAILQECDRAAA
jgi:hypothetical protein